LLFDLPTPGMDFSGGRGPRPESANLGRGLGFTYEPFTVGDYTSDGTVIGEGAFGA